MPVQPEDPGPHRLGDVDIHLFAEGTHGRIYEKLGAHPVVEGGRAGTRFAVWAPNAQSVAVIGDFEGWGRAPVPLQLHAGSGIWEGFLPGVGDGAKYKYRITSKQDGYRVDKADPYGTRCELPPATASIVCGLDSYQWRDAAWMKTRRDHNGLAAPMSIYEVHLGSWMRVPEEENRWLSYRELAPKLAAHVTACGFTHIELMPVAEHPFYPSWGYQVTGFFAPTSRYGTPEDFMWFVDYLHQREIGVILDWTPAHFPTDEHGLIYFDGTHLYEHADPRQGIHAEWGSAIFNYGRTEVRSFLVSNANFWLDRYHVDGLRVDAVASMLYLDYGRQDDWIPNQYGGRENLDAIEFMRTFNQATYRDHPDTQTIAEESTSWPMVSRPTYTGGLGFGMKWDMGWMHDTLEYFKQDPIGRRYHHHKLTFRSMYFWSENFVMPLSHDEVVHGKKSLIEKMPGDLWQRFANLRTMYGMMWAQPGKKLLFQGAEFGQYKEWAHDSSLDWNLLGETAFHTQLMAYITTLNQLYRTLPALHERDVGIEGFEWVDANDAENSVYSFLRRGKDAKSVLLAVFNCTPVPRHQYRIGLPFAGRWKELLNSDSEIFGGSGLGNLGHVEAERFPCHGRQASVRLTLPPLSATYFVPEE